MDQDSREQYQHFLLHSNVATDLVEFREGGVLRMVSLVDRLRRRPVVGLHVLRARRVRRELRHLQHPVADPSAARSWRCRTSTSATGSPRAGRWPTRRRSGRSKAWSTVAGPSSSRPPARPAPARRRRRKRAFFRARSRVRVRAHGVRVSTRHGRRRRLPVGPAWVDLGRSGSRDWGHRAGQPQSAWVRSGLTITRVTSCSTTYWTETAVSASRNDRKSLIRRRGAICTICTRLPCLPQ